MTCIEGLFGFVRIVPCYMGEGELSTEQVARLSFNAVVRFFGLPYEVLHDRNPCFTADFWRHLWDAMGSRAVFSSAYHPQTDGKAEWAYCTIEQGTRCMLAERCLSPEAWCEVVGALELRLNTAVYDSMGKPPALVALGEMPPLPVDLIVGTD